MTEVLASLDSRGIRSVRRIAAVALLFVGLGVGAGGDEQPRRSHDATSDHPFTGAERWSTVFDAPDRDAWQKPAEVIEALQIAPGMVVADVGAGTGYFLPYLSAAAGAGGIVLAIDTEPEMVAFMGRRIRRDRAANIVPVLALPEEPFLPRGRVDRILIVDTYHHIDDRLGYFGRLKQALTPGGRLAIVDFLKKPLPVGPPPEHKLERGQVIDEMVEAGWRLLEDKDLLPHQYFLIFEPLPPAAAPEG